MQLFSADPTVTEKKCIHENLKIRASKVAHNQLKPFFYSPAQPQSPQPRIIINTYVHCESFVWKGEEIRRMGRRFFSLNVLPHHALVITYENNRVICILQ
jgi:hypothetical protein